jgi:hypothetical protein
MANTYYYLNKATVGAGGQSEIVFSNIPQTYTDLKLVISARVTSGLVYSNATLKFNGSSTGYTNKRFTATGSGTTTDTVTNAGFLYIGEVNGDTSTAGAFSNLEVYIPGYTDSNNKSVSSEKVQESRATTSYLGFHANLWANSAAITSISIGQTSSGFLEHTTAYLYGIKKD